MGFKDYFDLSKKELKKLEKEYEKVEALAENVRSLSDSELQNKTIEFRERLSKSETLEDIKYEALAVVREASNRVLGLFPYPVQVMSALNLNEGNVSEQSTGEGKSNPIDTKIPTPDCWKTVGDIRVGDYLFDRKGNPTKVTGVYPQGKLNTYEVVLRDGRKVLCNDEHLWSVYPDYNRKNLRTLTTKELIANGVRKNRGFRYHLPVNGAVEYAEKALKIPPYVMGNFLGNGCKNDNKNFLLSTSDEETVKYIAELLNVKYFKGTNDLYRWAFHTDEIKRNKNVRLKIRDIDPRYEDLLSQTLCGDKYIPEEYKLGSIEQRWELLQGLMDSDGNIYKEPEGKRYNVSFSTTSEHLRDDVLEIIYSLGLSGKWGFSKSPEKHGVKNQQYEIRINVPHDVKPNFFKLSRKKNIAIEASQQPARRKDYSKIAIVEINDLQKETEQVCFTVDNPEYLFLIGDYVVTHNTVTGVLSTYLNSLESKVHVVTVNEYLSGRDGEEMGELLNWLGITVGINKQELTPEEKRAVYQADVIYSTNSELGFDYLRDNMARSKEDKIMSSLDYCLIDEVDSILIDEARTPLIISNNENRVEQMYAQVDILVKQLDRETELSFDIENRLVDLTEEGINKIERLTGIKNIYDENNVKFMHHVYMSMRANYVLKRDTDYVVDEGMIKLVDQFTGRIMEGRRYSDGLHQAIEAKEHVEIQSENKTMASITYQNYFRLYKKLSGMTGTARTEEEEFRDIYNMLVVSIPTNKPVIRDDRADLIFPTMDYKFKAIVNDIKYLHNQGQPILVGTSSVQYSEYLSGLLHKENIPHEVLNAKNHEREAEIILNAGQKGAVTIATNMAGRGTDIKLGLGVKELGGLAVLGTERYESRRIDNQLRGRSGRQGDVGLSQFYISLEDDLPKRFGSDKLKNVLQTLLATAKVEGEQNDMALRSKFIAKQFENAQKRVEGNNYDSRKNVLVYDDVLREQREVIYAQRDKLLEQSEDLYEQFLEIVKEYSEGYPDGQTENTLIDSEEFEQVVKSYRKEHFDSIESPYEQYVKIMEEKNLNSPENTVRIKQVMLGVLDEYWTNHLENMTMLRDSITLRGYAQIDPKVAYKEDGYFMYLEMVKQAKKEMVKQMLNVRTTTTNNTVLEVVDHTEFTDKKFLK